MLCLGRSAEQCWRACWRQAALRRPPLRQIWPRQAAPRRPPVRQIWSCHAVLRRHPLSQTWPRHAASPTGLPGCPVSAFPAPGQQASSQMPGPCAPAPPLAGHPCGLWLTQHAALAPFQHGPARFWPQVQRGGRHLLEIAEALLALACLCAPAAASRHSSIEV